MALKYHLVSRPDLSKNAPEGARLLYPQTRINDRVSLNELCEMISGYTAATKGDVHCVIKGLIFHMRVHLMHGRVVHLKDFGSFRIVAGSKGVATEKEFHPTLFKKPKIVFVPGTMLRDTPSKQSFQKLEVKEVPEECKRPHAG